MNSACGFVHLRVGAVFYCRYGLRSIERMGFYYFLNNKISKPGKMCVLHNVHMKSYRHMLWLQHLLYAFVPLLTSETNICIRCYKSHVRVLTHLRKKDRYMFITLLTFTENDVKYYFDQMGFQHFIKKKKR